MTDRTLVYMPLSKLRGQKGNPKAHAAKLLTTSMKRFGYTEAILLDERTKRYVAGHGRVEQLTALKRAGKAPPEGVKVKGREWLVPVSRGWRSKNDAEATAYTIASNAISERGGWVDDLLAQRLKTLAKLGEGGFAGVGYDAADLDRLLRQLKGDAGATGLKLADRFLVPPFSVLDGRAGYWLERKREWLDLGIESELGRDAKLLTTGGKRTDYVSSSHDAIGGGTSVFDPVVCEVVYRWFSPEGAKVLDPFAGGSVRGVVAAVLKRGYMGIDLRADQVEANARQARRIFGRAFGGAGVSWAVGDSRAILAGVDADATFDLVFTCPPYGDLERYSDDVTDLSTMKPRDFQAAYTQILVQAAAKLKPNRFMAVVVGNYRDSEGFYVDLVGMTIAAAKLGSCHLYNDAVIVTPLGTLPMRTAGHFPKGRKLGKAHQNLLVFFKGEPNRIATDFGDLVIPAEALRLVAAAPDEPAT